MDVNGNEKQKDTKEEILRQFKKAVFDVLTDEHTDAALMKFLRAGNFKIKISEYLFRENLWARAVYDVDKITLTTKKHEVAEKFEFTNHLGYAKDGTPILYVAMGRADLYGFILSMSNYDIGIYCSIVLQQQLLRAKESEKKLGKEIREIMFVIDMEGFDLRNNIHNSLFETGYDLFIMLQDHYPEVWKKLLLVNAAFYVYKTYDMFRPIFRDMFIQNTRVASKEDTPALLLEYIDAEVLPVFLGGTRVDSKGDPMCSEFMKFGGTVDESYYSAHKPLLEPIDSETECVWIKARSCFNYSVLVLEPNSRLKIEFRTEGGSIGMSTLYREFGPDPDHIDIPSETKYLNPRDGNSNVFQISPSVKIQSHISPVDSYCRAPKSGIYIFKFDNTCNWWTSRKLIFRIQVLPPS